MQSLSVLGRSLTPIGFCARTSLKTGCKESYFSIHKAEVIILG